MRYECAVVSPRVARIGTPLLAAVILAAAAAQAHAQARVVARAPGPIGAVQASGNALVWVRCPPDFGSHQIWARLGGGRAHIVTPVGSGADCGDTKLLGIPADRVVVDATSWGFRDWTPRQLIVAGLRGAPTVQLDSARPNTIFSVNAYYVEAPALAEGTVTWWRLPPAAPSQLMTVPVGAPATPPTVGAVRDGAVDGTWYNRRGDALLQEWDGPGSALILRTTDGGERVVAEVPDSQEVIGADLNDRWLTFTVRTHARATQGRNERGTVHAWSLSPLRRVASWPVAFGPSRTATKRGVGVGRLAGDALLWAAHAGAGGRTRDGIRIAHLPSRSATWLWSTTSPRDRSVWVTRPAVARRSAVLGVTRFPDAGGEITQGQLVPAEIVSAAWRR